MTRNKHKSESAVSPVIGILLMIVVTLIIAAIVSGFAGSLISGQQKVPQAQVSGEFSLSDGFILTHEGGDPIATKDMVVTIKNSRLWGPDVEQRTIQLVNKTFITDNTGKKHWEFANGTTEVSSFNPGDSALINTANCKCDILQPIIKPSDASTKLSADGLTYTGTKTAFWALCFRNPANVGKTFIMEVSDKATGKLISKSDVKITS